MHVESQYSITAIVSVGENAACGTTIPAWNCSTPLGSVAQIVSADYSYNTLIIALQTGCVTSGAVTFEASIDGVNWFPITGYSPGQGGAIGPVYTLQANTYTVAEFNLTALPYFQIVLTSPITGTTCGSPPVCGSVAIGFSADSFVTTPPPCCPTSQVVTQGTTPWIVDIGNVNTTAYGSPAVQALDVYVVNPVSVIFPSSLSVTQGTTPWVVSGTVAATQSGVWTVGLTGATFTVAGSPAVSSLNTFIEGGTVCVTQCTSPWVVSGTVAATQSGTWNVGVTGQTYTVAGSPAVSSLNVFVEGGSIAVTGTVSISGTVAVTQSGSWTVAVSGTVAVTQSGTWTVGVTGQTYTVAGSPAVSSLNTFIEGGTVCVTQCTSPWVVNLTQIAGAAVATACAGVQQIAVVGHACGVFDAITGAAVPANAVQIGASDGANLQPLRIKLAEIGPIGTDPALVVTQSPAGRQTYRAATIQTALQATPTDVAQIIGSATKIIRVMRVFAQGGATAKSGSMDCSIVKRSTADTGGTSTVVPGVPLDSNDAAATAVVRQYTANPALGTSLGRIASAYLTFSNGSTFSTTPTPLEIPLPLQGGVQGVVLRGAAEALCINLNGQALPATGMTFSFTYEWTEE